MSLTPFFTIGIPMFNAANDIQMALNSIRAEEFDDYEVVCIDDGSQDDTYEKVISIAKTENRIRVFTNGTNKGIAFTRKEITKLARGQFFIWMDADDQLLQGALKRLYDFFSCEQNKNSILIQNAIVNNAGERRKLYRFDFVDTDPKKVQEKMLLSNGIGSYPWSIVGKTSFFNRVDYPEDSKLYVDDQLTSFRYLDKAERVSFMKQPNYVHNLEAGSDSHSQTFYKRLFNTYSYLEQTVPSDFLTLQKSLRAMAMLSLAFFYSKSALKSKYSSEFELKYYELVRECRINHCFSKSSLKYLGKKQRTQCVLLATFPQVFWKYYSMKEFVK